MSRKKFLLNFKIFVQFLLDLICVIRDDFSKIHYTVKSLSFLWIISQVPHRVLKISDVFFFTAKIKNISVKTAKITLVTFLWHKPLWQKGEISLMLINSAVNYCFCRHTSPREFKKLNSDQRILLIFCKWHVKLFFF